MKAIDFIFAGHTLSSFDMIICEFDSIGIKTTNGVQVSFNTVPVLNGVKSRLISSQYEENLETTISICRNPCNGRDIEIDPITFRELTKWLCRKTFHKLKFLGDEGYIDLYYEVKIDVNKIELGGKLIGLELNIQTNSPFPRKEPRTIIIKNITQNGKHSINDTSYEEGYIYPNMEITMESDGDLDIYNAIEDRHTVIKNCVQGETITMNYPIIQSTALSHNIQNDFNWNFFRIANTFENSRNDLTISIPCTIKVKYSPIVKIGL